MGKLGTLKKTNLYEQAIDSLLNYIIVNGLTEGDKLPAENQLKDIFGISRNTLREALKSLQLLGIIETKQHSGIVVKDFSISDLTKFVPYSLRVEDKNLRSLCEAREWMEQGLLPVIVERRTDEDLAKLADIIAAIDRGIEDGSEIAELDFQFHQAMVECCNNTFINNVNTILRDFFTLYVREKQASTKPDSYMNKSHQITNNDHRLILQYITERNLPLLQKIHKKHLNALALQITQIGAE
ncbi:MAG: FadR family transcriptional regulator [Paenibacillaceae bacterium]|nr:FadR family transcriptional regulator [Paenibacillaceae bacterium]